MTKLGRSFILATAATLALPSGIATAQPAPPPTQPVQPLEYAAKIVCGRATGDNDDRQALMAAGNYYTAVNVHNPSRPVRISHKVTLADVGRPGPMTDIRTDITLNYDQAIDFDCRWIVDRLRRAGIAAPPFFTGFLVLQVRTQMDVVAVYSAGNPTQVATMHTERVPVRRVP